MMGAPFDQNEHGVWCLGCGEIILAPWNDGFDDPDQWPDECRTCGWPEDVEKMAEYFA